MCHVAWHVRHVDQGTLVDLVVVHGLLLPRVLLHGPQAMRRGAARSACQAWSARAAATQAMQQTMQPYIQVPAYTGAGIYGCRYIRVPAYTGAGIYGCRYIRVPAHTGAGIYGCRYIRVPAHTGAGIYGCRHIRVPVYTGAGIYGCRHIRVPAHTGAGIYGCRHIRVPAYTGAGIYGCRHIRVPALKRCYAGHAAGPHAAITPATASSRLGHVRVAACRRAALC
jgi:hypothetical protein